MANKNVNQEKTNEFVLQYDPSGKIAASESEEAGNLATGLNTVTEELQFLLAKEKKLTARIRELNALLEKKEEEKMNELAASEKKYNILFESNPMPMWVIDAEHSKFLDVNEAAIIHYGYSRAEFLNMTALDIRHQKEQERFVRTDFSFHSTPYYTGTWEHVKKDGTIIHVHINVGNLSFNGKPAKLILANDVSEKIRSEERTKKLLYRFGQAQKIAHVGNWELNFKSGKSVWSDEACRIYGLSTAENEQPFKSWLSFIHPEDLEAVNKEIEKTRLSLSPSSFEHRIIRRDGTIRHILSVSEFEFDAEGKPIGLIGVCHDITDRKKADHAYVESEQRMRTFMDESLLAVYFIDPVSKKIIYANSAFEHLLGYTAEELNTIDIYDFINHPKENIDARMEEALKMKKLALGERKWKRKDGQIVHVLVSSFCQETNGTDRIYVIAHDITDRKVAEEKLIRSEMRVRNFARHLNDVRENEKTHLAREMHDELGQQLAGLKLGLSSLKNNAGNDEREKISGLMKDVDATIQSIRKIATELRPGILDTLGLIPSIHWLVTEFERKAQIACIQKVNVKKQQFEKSISTCFFRICQETFTNILKHAGANKVIVAVQQTKEELTLSISDNGKGMADEKLENPFSMGLLGMRERAKDIGADLFISSRKNAGTTVKIVAKL